MLIPWCVLAWPLALLVAGVLIPVACSAGLYTGPGLLANILFILYLWPRASGPYLCWACTFVLGTEILVWHLLDSWLGHAVLSLLRERDWLLVGRLYTTVSGGLSEAGGCGCGYHALQACGLPWCVRAGPLRLVSSGSTGAEWPRKL